MTPDVQRQRALQLAVLAVLDQAKANSPYVADPALRWSVQGFGVLRLYIRDLGRLHLWNQALAYPNVSTIHTHSWDLRSIVVAGTLANTRYHEVSQRVSTHDGAHHWRQRLITGYDSRNLAGPVPVRLVVQPQELYHAGDIYEQTASEIHRTDAVDGTITLMERHEDVDGQADVYWPATCTWGTAKPRYATPAEVITTVEKALATLTEALRS